MSTLAHRPSKLRAPVQSRLAMWLLGAVLVAAVAITLALSLGGSGDQQTDRGADAGQAAPQAPQAPTPLGGARP
jgi:predicted outer membrane lipoprotein